MNKKTKIGIGVGVGVLALGGFLFFKHSKGKGQANNNTIPEELEPVFTIDEVLELEDNTYGVFYTFGDVLSHYDTYQAEQIIKPYTQKNSIYSLKIHTKADDGYTDAIFFDLLKDGKFLKTLKKQ